MLICSINLATASKRSGWRGARIMTACGWPTRRFSKALSSGASSSSTVLPHTSTGPAPSTERDRRRRRQVHIELQIAGDFNPLRVGSDRLQTVAVFLRLRQEEINLRQHAAQ